MTNPTGMPLQLQQALAASASQTRTVLSKAPLAMRLPSPLKLTCQTASVCPSAQHWPLCASQIRTVLSSEPLAMRLPSLLTSNP